MTSALRPVLLTTAALGLVAIPPLAPAQTVTLVAPGAEEGVVDTLEASSLVLALAEEDAPSTAQDYVASAQADYRRLLTALYAEGHYGGAISILIDGREAATLSPLGAPDQIGAVEIRVDPGPQFSFGRAVVAPLPPGTELTEDFRPGAPARATVIRDAARGGVTAWREAGHAKADISGEEVTARHSVNELDAAITLDPGPVLSFGPLIVSGNSAVRTERIVEIAGLPRGERFSPTELDRSVSRLRRTGTFASVVLREAEEIGPGGTLPIFAEVQEEAPRRLGFGVELSSTDGLTLSGYWLHRNLLGGAESLRIDGEVSDLEEGTEGGDVSLTFSFSRPATFNPDNELYAELEFGLLQEELLTYRAAEAEIGLNRIVNEEFSTSAGIGLRYAEVETEEFEVTYTLVTLPLAATLDRRDDEFDATSGYFLDVELTPFFGLAEADDGARLYTDARYYRSFGEADRVTLATRLQFGSVVGAEEADAPQDFLFFSGGGGTVRGQEFNSLGVMRDGFEVGGNSFLGAQLEARVQVTERIEGVAFYDIGLVGIDPLPGEDDPWHAGAGLGLRYQTGIGPIRLDIAAPVSGGDDDAPDVQVYIGIGQAF